ncbi:PrpF domain-containing protein [Gordonia sp. (in: high G+C Gram-positive bacteria)]|uniref:PrpF domain-containing protein n=1 Tax=Gordonia sp. (in: high G+C Gram-positive bacteria) TaxID=84139 RepID=UPI003F97560E
MLVSIPAMMMRGGTSRGMYFVKSELASPGVELDRVLPALMGSPGPGQIDGLGGGSTTTSKVAVVSRSADPNVDVDYLFAQVDPLSGRVDWRPTCGNVLAGVAPFAIERGMVVAGPERTRVRVRLVNTNAHAVCTVPTPGGSIRYDFDESAVTAIHPSVPVRVEFRGFIGGSTGALLPTGNACDTVDGVEFSAVDAGVCAVIVRAADVGLQGDEPQAEINANPILLQRIANIRAKAAELMGMGDVCDSVLPKVMVTSVGSTDHADITSRYFVPATCHPAHAVSGGVCLATAARTPGTVVASQIGDCRNESGDFTVAHPSGKLCLKVAGAGTETSVTIDRTARKLFDGQVFASLHEVAC